MVVGVGAVVAGVIMGTDLDGGSQDGLFGMLVQVADQLFLVHAIHGAHQGGRLQFTGALLAHFIGGACQVAHIAVAGGVDEDLGADFHSAALAEEGHGQQLAVFHIGVDDLGVQQNFNAGFHALFESHHLEHFVVINGNGIVHRAPVVRAAGALPGQLIHKLLGDAPDDLVSIQIQIAQQGQAEGHVAAQVTVLFHQQHLCTLAGSSDGSGQAAGAAAYNNNVILQSFQFHVRILPCFVLCWVMLFT